MLLKIDMKSIEKWRYKSDKNDKNMRTTKPVEPLKALEALSLYEAQLV